jgi:hypothetical protein
MPLPLRRPHVGILALYQLLVAPLPFPESPSLHNSEPEATLPLSPLDTRVALTTPKSLQTSILANNQDTQQSVAMAWDVGDRKHATGPSI